MDTLRHLNGPTLRALLLWIPSWSSCWVVVGGSKCAPITINALANKQDRLIKEWGPLIDPVEDYFKSERGRPMNVMEKRNLAQVLENALLDSGLKSRSKLFETTTEDNISFLGVQLPVISAVMPTLVANDICTVQALDRRDGSVFYFDVKYGSTKGAVTSGATMVSSTTGHARTKAGRLYGVQWVEDEALVDEGGGSAATYTGTVDYAPGLQMLNYVTVKDANGVVLGRSNAAGTITAVGATGVTGTITAAGVYSLDFSATTLGSGVGATISYMYQYDLPKDANNNNKGVPEVDFSVTQSTVRALDFPIRSKYSVGSAIDLTLGAPAECTLDLRPHHCSSHP